jgi:very-short-patch-repair endonuclease
MPPTNKQPNTVLVAIINDLHDYDRLLGERWYRIPVDKAPPIIREGKARIIAFYPTAKFKEDKWKIRHYGVIKRMTEASRQELFPEEKPNNPKAHKRYYKIELEKVEELPQPIVSRRGHRITFLPTTERRFFNYTDINFLFNGSSLEEKIFGLLNEARIPAEREWVQTINGNTYLLDFAIFCKSRPIDVECDGDAWHDTPERVHYDKNRNNELESHGWSVLRFTQERIEREPERAMSVLYDTINRNGGYQVLNEPDSFSYVQRGSQLRLDF